MDWLRPLHLLVVYLFLVVTISTVACSTSDEVEYTDLQYTTSSPPTGYDREASPQGPLGETLAYPEPDDETADYIERDKTLMLQAIRDFSKALSHQHKHFRRDDSRSPATERLRGIVISGGTELYFVNAYATMRVIREVHGSNIPIVLAYYGAEEYVPWIATQMLAMPNIHLRDTSLEELPAIFQRHGLDKAELMSQGYFKKIMAIFRAPFHEILYLDADSLPLSSPDDFFLSPTYLERGNMFFPEVWKEGVPESPEPEFYEILGLEPPWYRGPWSGVESGQFLFDRERHWHVLHWVVFLNSYHDILYETYVYGDKDLFEVAFELAGERDSFFRGPVLPRLALTDEKLLPITVPAGSIRVVGEVHSSEMGIPWFLHRVASNKLVLDALVEWHSWPTVISAPITHELTHAHMHWVPEYGFHIFAPEFVTAELNCETVDEWTLRFWKENPILIPLRQTDALVACLLSFSEHAGLREPVQTPQPLTLVPVGAFGEILSLSLDFQKAALGSLKLLKRRLEAKQQSDQALRHEHS